MASNDPNDDDLIRKVDALMSKHRGAEARPRPGSQEDTSRAGDAAAAPSPVAPAPTGELAAGRPAHAQPGSMQAGLLPADDDPDIPVLTDVVLRPPPLFEQPEVAAADTGGE